MRKILIIKSIVIIRPAYNVVLACRSFSDFIKRKRINKLHSNVEKQTKDSKTKYYTICLYALKSGTPGRKFQCKELGINVGDFEHLHLCFLFKGSKQIDSKLDGDNLVTLHEEVL